MSSDSIPSVDEFVPESQAELDESVRDNASGPQLPLYPVGGRTALNFGHPAELPGVTVSTVNLNAVIDYPARDMTITVEAGIRMDEIAAALKLEKQQLPIDVPQSNRATLGGVAATNVSGPRRFGFGTMRDYVIGIAAVDADGRLFHAGGRVVKNVAGYDLCKLLVGSMGTLGIITEITLKLRPIANHSAIVWTGFDSFASIDRALEALSVSETRPVAIEVLNRPAAAQMAAESRHELPAQSPVLAIGYEGSQVEVDWQVGRVKRELSTFKPKQVHVVRGDDVGPLMMALTDYQICSDDPLSFQAQVLPSRTMSFVDRLTRAEIAVQAHAGNGIVIGHLPDSVATAEKAEAVLAPLRAAARDARGNLVVWDCPSEWKSRLRVFGEPHPSWPLMQHLKKTLDPRDLLNPARFIAH